MVSKAMRALSAQVKKVRLTGLRADIGPTYLRVEPGTNLAGCVEIAKRITAVGYGYWWWVADLAEYARHHLEKPEEFLDQLCAATGCRLPYLKLLADTAKRYPVRDRVAGLSITHHMRVMRVSHTRRQWLLHEAATKGWSVRVLADRVTPLEDRVFTIVIKVPLRHRRNTKLAAALRVLVEEWDADIRYWTGARARGKRRALREVA